MIYQTRLERLVKESLSICPKYKDALQFASPFVTSDQRDQILKQSPYDRYDPKIYQTICDSLYGRRPDKAAEIWQNVIAAAEYTRPKLIDNDFSGYQITQLDRNIIAHMGIDLGSFILCRMIVTIGHDHQMDYKMCNEEETRTVISNTHYYMPRSNQPVKSKPRGYATMDVDDYKMNEDIYWISGAVQMPQLPDTVAAALVGQKLSALIDHPIFCDHDIEIIHVRQEFKESLFRTNYNPRNWPSTDIADIAKEELTKLTVTA